MTCAGEVFGKHSYGGADRWVRRGPAAADRQACRLGPHPVELGVLLERARALLADPRQETLALEVEAPPPNRGTGPEAIMDHLAVRVRGDVLVARIPLQNAFTPPAVPAA
ncbi:hypothetical protein GCM10009527_077410 [Actinomadura nitritigenes]